MKAGTVSFCLICLLGIAFRAASQSPGYRGKHVSAGYGAYTSPGVISSNDYAIFNFLHEGFVEFAVAKKVSLGLALRYYNTAVNNEGRVEWRTDFYHSVGGNVKGETHVKGLNYMAYAKLFRKNYLAPWGKYFVAGATLNTYVASYNPDQVYVTFQSAYGGAGRFSDFGPGSQSHIKFDIFFGNGRSRIIADRIILDYGYNINVWAATTLIDDLLENKGKVADAALYIDKISSKRVRESTASMFF